MARNDRKKFIEAIKVGDVITYLGVKYEVTGIPPVPQGWTEEEVTLMGIVNRTSLYVRPVNPDMPLKMLRSDVQNADGEDY